MKCLRRGLILLAVMLCVVVVGCGSGIDGEGFAREYQLGIEYLSAGEYQEAVLAFSAAIEIDPRSPEAFEGRGDAYFAMESYGLAAADYEMALELDDGKVLLYRKIADCYTALGDEDEAVRLLELGLERTGDLSLEEWLEQLQRRTAMLHELAEVMASGDFDRMQELALDPEYRQIWMDLREGELLYLGDLSGDGVRQGIGFSVDWGGNYYYGEWRGGEQSGQGLMVNWTLGWDDGKYDWKRYEGVWAGGLPNGEGVYEARWMYRESDEMRYERISGGFRDGYHHGVMDVYDEGTEGGVFHWNPITAIDGVWQEDPSLTETWTEEGYYPVAKGRDDAQSTLYSNGLPQYIEMPIYDIVERD